MKHIFKCLALGVTALLMGACNDSESDLLESHLYFENREYTLSVEDEQSSIEYNLTSRLSSKLGTQVEVSYTLADKSVVDEYNAKYGTAYEMFDPANVKLSSTTSVIPAGKVYADNVKMEISNLDAIEDGKPFVIPVRVQSNSVSVLPGTSVAYFFITKPIKITKAVKLNGNYISVKYHPGTFFKSFTYEALINVNYFGSNNTIMGTEGVMIFRIGDPTLPSNKILELAGRQHYNVSENLKENQWYHVAATYDQPTGKTAIYVNGAKWAESSWSIPGFDPNSDVGFNIGKIPGFPWGERPLNGYMSEVRVWDVARTENQINQNMLSVDPKSDGLVLYYKLDGSETQTGNKIQDATGNYEGSTGGALNVVELDSPIEIK